MEGTTKPPGLLPAFPAAKWERDPKAPSLNPPVKEATHQSALPHSALLEPFLHLYPSLDMWLMTQRHSHPRNQPQPEWSLSHTVSYDSHPLSTTATVSCPPALHHPSSHCLSSPHSSSSRPLDSSGTSAVPHLRKRLLRHFTQLPAFHHSNHSFQGPSSERPSLTICHSDTSPEP